MKSSEAPFFSVIIPTYNRAHLLRKTIECVINQSYKSFELIIIDDASTDNTNSIVSSVKDARIGYYKNEINIERSASRNKGIKLALGRFVCFCDSDDHWRENHLALLFDKIQKENETQGIYFTGITWNFPDYNKEIVFPDPTCSNPVEYVITNQIAPTSTCISTNILHQFRFREDLKINEDVELFSRIVSAYPLFQIPVSTVDFIIHAENTKGLNKNYISPQIDAMDIIFNNPLIKNSISESFKKNIYKNLHHQLINHYFENKDFLKMNVEIVRYLLLYPFDFQNKSKLVLLLYHLPGGVVLQKAVGLIKKKG
jgi:glycosyltransferase involved in cell wall biosynthesis